MLFLLCYRFLKIARLQEEQRMELELMEIGDAARIIGISTETLRLYADEERIKHTRTTSGRRLFFKKDVEKFAENYKKRKAS